MKNSKLLSIGLLQALGVVAYTSLISSFFWYMGENFPQAEPNFLFMVLMLTLLVFSAAVTGSIIFGYPAYLVLNKRVKEGLAIFGYTLFFSSMIIVLVFITIIANL